MGFFDKSNKPAEPKDQILTREQKDKILTHEKKQLGIFLLSKKMSVNTKYIPTNHNAILQECIDQVNTNLQKLKSIDRKATIAFSLGTAALLLPFIPFNWAITLVGFSYGFYQMGKRVHAYKEYTDSLEALKQCCNWTLGGSLDQEQTEVEFQVQQNKTMDVVKNILPTLAPLMNKAELQGVLHDSIEDNILAQTGVDFDKQQHTFEFKMYGYGQGSFSDALTGFAYVIQNAWNSLTKSLTSNEETEVNEFKIA